MAENDSQNGAKPQNYESRERIALAVYDWTAILLLPMNAVYVTVAAGILNNWEPLLTKGEAFCGLAALNVVYFSVAFLVARYLRRVE